MPLYEKVSGSYLPISPYEKISGVWTPIVLYEKISGVWTVISSQIAISASDVFGSVTNNLGSALVTSGTPGTTPSSGIGSYTYAWARQSGDASIICSNAAIQNPTWSKTLTAGAGDSTNTTAVWRVTVTDSASQTAHADINVSLTYINNHS